jgi:hypothetical protein
MRGLRAGQKWLVKAVSGHATVNHAPEGCMRTGSTTYLRLGQDDPPCLVCLGADVRPEEEGEVQPAYQSFQGEHL